MMNSPESIKKLRELLKQYGGWENLHKASTLKDGYLIVKHKGDNRN